MTSDIGRPFFGSKMTFLISDATSVTPVAGQLSNIVTMVHLISIEIIKIIQLVLVIQLQNIG